MARLAVIFIFLCLALVSLITFYVVPDSEVHNSILLKFILIFLSILFLANLFFAIYVYLYPQSAIVATHVHLSYARIVFIIGSPLNFGFTLVYSHISSTNFELSTQDAAYSGVLLALIAAIMAYKLQTIYNELLRDGTKNWASRTPVIKNR
jgi:hypothetical protein